MAPQIGRPFRELLITFKLPVQLAVKEGDVSDMWTESIC